MKRGLTLTLMTVAIAMLSLQAMAAAPVIGTIPSPIIGDEGGMTQPREFVFKDAINLTSPTVVLDPDTSSSALKWSYEMATTQVYEINGVEPVTESDGIDIYLNPGAKQINNQVLGGEYNPDGKAATITIRNIKWSPVVNAAASEPDYLGVGDAQVVTLYASDGTTFTSEDVIFYTSNGGFDGFTGEMPPYERVKQETFSGTVAGFAYTNYGATSGTAGGTALCIEGGADHPGTTENPDGAYIGQWDSAYNYITVAANTVFNIRAYVNGSQTSAGHTPFWDMYVSNYVWDGSAMRGLNLFGGDAYIQDNRGGANSALSTSSGSGTLYQMWWTPLAIDTPQFTNSTSGAFIAANADGLGASVSFRMLDVDAQNGKDKSGSLCLTTLIVDKWPLSSMRLIGSSPIWSVNGGQFAAANASGTGTVLAETFVGTQFTYPSGNLLITPSTASAGVDVITITPGRNLDWAIDDDPATTQNEAQAIADNFPVAWQSDKLIMLTAEMAAPTATDASNPLDVILLGMDNPTNEVLMESFVTNEANFCATPKTTAATYRAFFWTHKVSVSTNAYHKFLRPRLFFYNSASLTKGNNTGATRVSKLAVQEVVFE